MACAGCGRARAQLASAVRHGSVIGVAKAVGTALAVNVDKLRGVDVQAKYGGKKPVQAAQPYKRTT